MSSAALRVLQDVAWVPPQVALVPPAAGQPARAHSPRFAAHGIHHAFLGRGGDGGQFQHVKQVHGTDIVAAQLAAQSAGQVHADGIYTTSSEVTVAVKTADCVPLLCCDRRARHFALALHAGRRGLLAGIVARAVAALDAHAVRRADTLWAIGPAVGAAAYEVGPEEMEALCTTELSAAQMALCLGKGKDDRWHLDLQLLAVLQLLNAGISAQQLSVIRICTYTAAELFHSLRFDQKHNGSNWSYLSLT